ncbi:hypothetical protein [Saccharopolyspora mangrovi]|uniref:Uncharacterized protein n=1 Tax=Saccharopolyspora mangrovi TaxID=3082379 RepID=A0ABU6ADT5_9PSEU|nr:hypothetical protein [Saccharopolyspora sp. S2-29]MEB3369714.1 hypothetical protein [Saccharopolyspora sp. S2-29]
MLAGQALAKITGIPLDASILLCAGLSAAIAIVGYRLIHRFG